ncbi:bifunctional diguanylate cyclase/phosphodiesterase [Paenibacillus hexagrammi]|uniref:EAL and GGDEF domain-containing protein n=1 Tax=Paenibacillus hexagrammi TaxID=2908839 RepID=A0ABY3SEN9_9BACL|nr:bifunctional diguanylate cyclase/phosphodiesterase [Paenibacillus sp. YPD9-1]UJF31704.1 EAL and GGDEF domain-containing protein [Paenibacillus sp. YPD9-1]
MEKNTEFQTLIEQQLIYTVYQPIVSLQSGEIYGYEALTRAPGTSRFTSPVDLFQFAEEQGELYKLEKLAREKAIQGAKVNADQLLFINISSHVLHDPQFVPGKTLDVLSRHGLQPHNVVFEITERSSIEDFTLAKQILEHYRKQGYRIAIDDAGAGYSSLQAIAELQPDFIKIDRSLIENIHKNKMKEYILETFVTFAQKMNISLVAEGIEHMEELIQLTRMGIHYAQGYLLGKPSIKKGVIDARYMNAIGQNQRLQSGGAICSIGNLAAPVKVFDHKTLISEVADYAKKNQDCTGVVITNGMVPVGLLMRDQLFQHLAGQYAYSLFSNRTVDLIMDASPLIVDEGMAVEQVSQMATARSNHNLYDLVIITSEGKLLGTASVRAILECITNIRMESARIANPLTGLPGNQQIQRELGKRIMDRKPFHVVYADLDYFKWFNDRFGFQRGDQLIQYTADILQQAIAACGTPRDFVGHVGGDDFIAISSSLQPELLCQEMIRRFEQGVQVFYEGEEWDFVRDRSGAEVPSDGVTLSLSLVVCRCDSAITVEQISQTAAGLKKQAKAHHGSVYFMTYLHESV